MNDMRKAFEQWFTFDDPNCRAIERNGDSYKLAQTEYAWFVWRAAWDESHAKTATQPCDNNTTDTADSVVS